MADYTQQVVDAIDDAQDGNTPLPTILTSMSDEMADYYMDEYEAIYGIDCY